VKPTALCIATRNAHKLGEIRAVLADLPLEITSAADHPGCPEVDEDGATLEANAEKKACVVSAFTGILTLADDSGLEVDALGGAPGVSSARFAGLGCSYGDNNAKLLRELSGVPDERRTARFRCVIALADPDASRGVSLHEGRIEGRILHEPRGGGGFGYDPIFWVPEAGCSLAELPPDRKNAISHRARALAAARVTLMRLLEA
jgi:XTP/dITP diphosphohydrolase